MSWKIVFTKQAQKDARKIAASNLKPKAQCLLDIPRWDFGWQLFYTLEQPIGLEVGDKLRLTCAYDTTTRTTTTTWGPSTEDEMCLGYTYFTD